MSVATVVSSWAFCKFSKAHHSTSDTVSILGLLTLQTVAEDKQRIPLVPN